MPLVDSSINTVFAKDLFGAHGKLFMYLDRPFTLESLNNLEDIGEGHAKEWFRKLKPGGKVVVVEVSTPLDRNILIEEFTKVGFNKTEEHLGENAVDVYRRSKDMKYSRKIFARDSYALVFQKPSK